MLIAGILIGLMGFATGYLGGSICEHLKQYKSDLVSEINICKGDLIALHMKVDKLLGNMVQQSDSSL